MTTNSTRNAEMTIRIEDVIEEMEKHNPEAEVSLVRKAYIFSAQQHKDQVRRSGEPYLIHPLSVAMILAEMGLDQTAIAVGLLHDVLEDTLTTRKTLEKLFGVDIANIVEGVTKIGKIPFKSLEEKQARNFRKMLIAMVDDVRVILVKLADRLHNMRTLEHMPPDKQERISKETMDIYIPIAHRLGMGSTKLELEDLCFLYLESEKYASLKERVEAELPVNMETIHEVKDRMEQAMEESSIPCRIEWRIKSIYSIYRKSIKLERKHNIEYDFHDYIAFRIITKEIIHCYAAIGILHSIWKPVPGQFDDYIANPKPNNYQSLHTVLVDRKHRFEVQIRTGEMHDIAEIGIAAHWRYKEGLSENEESWMDRYYEWMRALIEGQEEVEDPREFLQSLKADLLPGEVYTFTPKGDLFSLPTGATPLDFAYTIHTSVGHQCIGAKVNGIMVPLHSKLKSGDTVEIITSKGHQPNRDWLNIVVSGKARNKIRQHLNKQEKIRSVELGAKMLEKELHNHSISLKRLRNHPDLQDTLKDYGYASLEDLQSAVWFGKFSPRVLIQRLFLNENQEELKEQLEEQKLAKRINQAREASDNGVIVKGAEDILTYLAPCCKPVYGEDIIGYITRGKGIAVHRSDCSNIGNLHPDRRIEVLWADSRENVMPVNLIILTEDSQGIMARLVNRIDEEKINIRGVSAKTSDDNMAEFNITLDVTGIDMLKSITRKLREVRGVIEIQRQ
jgi:guanosine-3',5'-bis(diphosphate) 3'-pyrophosphohydrolase